MRSEPIMLVMYNRSKAGFRLTTALISASVTAKKLQIGSYRSACSTIITVSFRRVKSVCRRHSDSKKAHHFHKRKKTATHRNSLLPSLHFYEPLFKKEMRRETFYKALGFVIVADTDNNVKQKSKGWGLNFL